LYVLAKKKRKRKKIYAILGNCQKRIREERVDIENRFLSEFDDWKNANSIMQILFNVLNFNEF